MLELTYDVSKHNIPLLSLLNISIQCVLNHEKAFASSPKVKEKKLKTKNVDVHDAASIMPHEGEESWMEVVEKVWKKRIKYQKSGMRKTSRFVA